MRAYFLRLMTLLMVIIGCQCPSSKEQRVSVFNDCKPPVIRTVSEDDFIKQWFYLPVTHGGKGFNPVFIPFSYKSNGVEPDTNQSLTFSSLMSFKFDFVPDNFSGRHPAFAYARDSSARKMNITNPYSEIAEYIESWSATHAIGGELIQSKQGYSGTMVVFDTTGKKIFRKVYKKPVTYFTLMGKMVRDWMDFSGWTVSKKLLTELMRPMTNDMETVRMYGQVFSVRHRSQDEWDIYEDILKRDSDFAEVRFWYANQKGWQTGDNEVALLGYAQALESHMVIPALCYFDKRDCTAESLIEILKRKISYAQKIFPVENPRILGAMMNIYGDDLSIQELDSLFIFAKDYPSYHPLLIEFGLQYRRYNHLDKAIPIYLSAVYSGYLASEPDWALLEVGYNFTKLGYLAEGDGFCKRALTICRSDNQWIYYHLACNLRERFCFAEAADYFKKSYLALDRQYILLAAYMSLYEAEKLDIIKQWMEEKRMQPTDQHVKSIIEARQAIAAENFSRAMNLMRNMPFNNINVKVDSRIQLEAEILKADICLLTKDKVGAVVCASNAFYVNPRSRMVLHLLELSLDDPQKLGRLFYITGFIFPEQSYWQDKLQEIRNKGFKEEIDEDILQLYQDLKREYDEFLGAKVDFWIKQDPFYVEYICLRMLIMSEKKIQEQGLKLYSLFLDDLKNYFPSQTPHARTFSMMLLNHIPKNERVQWKEKI